jgi:uncharacterized membrane protein YgcG
MAGYGNNSRNDGRIVKRTKIKESKNGKEYNYCYVEIGGNLWKISVTNAEKESNKENAGEYWVGMKNCGRSNGGNRGGNRGGNSYGGGRGFSNGGGRTYGGY